MKGIRIIQWIIAGILFLTSSCSTHINIDNSKEIDLTQKLDTIQSLALGTFSNNIEYIQLETSKNSFIGRFENISIQKKHIFVFDRMLNKVFVFDRGGNFVKQIGIEGKGPGEHGTIFDFSVDASEKNVYIYTIGDRILQYDINSGYQRTIHVPKLKMAKFKSVEDGFIGFIPYPNSALSDGKTFFKLDDQGNIQNTMLTRSIEFDKTKRIVPPTNWNCFNNTISFWETGYDTIYHYSLNTESFEPKFSLKIENDALSQEDFSTSMGADSKIKSGNFLLSSIYETPHHIFFQVVKYRYVEFWLFDKRTNELRVISTKTGFRFKNDIDSGPDLLSPMIKGDYLIGILHYHTLKDYLDNQNRNTSFDETLMNLYQNMNESSNPILQIVKL